MAAYLGDTIEVVLAAYTHFLPDDGRAREIMESFFAPLSAAADRPSARDVPGGTR